MGRRAVGRDVIIAPRPPRRCAPPLHRRGIRRGTGQNTRQRFALPPSLLKRARTRDGGRMGHIVRDDGNRPAGGLPSTPTYVGRAVRCRDRPVCLPGRATTQGRPSPRFFDSKASAAAKNRGGGFMSYADHTVHRPHESVIPLSAPVTGNKFRNLTADYLPRVGYKSNCVFYTLFSLVSAPV